MWTKCPDKCPDKCPSNFSARLRASPFQPDTPAGQRSKNLKCLVPHVYVRLLYIRACAGGRAQVFLYVKTLTLNQYVKTILVKEYTNT